MISTTTIQKWYYLDPVPIQTWNDIEKLFPYFFFFISVIWIEWMMFEGGNRRRLVWYAFPIYGKWFSFVVLLVVRTIEKILFWWKSVNYRPFKDKRQTQIVQECRLFVGDTYILHKWSWHLPQKWGRGPNFNFQKWPHGCIQRAFSRLCHIKRINFYTSLYVLEAILT